MTRIIYRDRAFFVPDTETESQEIYRQLDIAPGHDLVLVRPEGNRLLNRRGKVELLNEDAFIDVPVFEYGSQASEVS